MDARRGPFIGPRPFGREDGSIFFGRDGEASELLSLVIAHPAVLLYAQSGAGKTSLLQAKLLPMLETRGSQVLGPARVGGSLPAGLSAGEAGNVFLGNALAMLGASGAGTSSFREALAACPRPERVIRRILVFDQFEEIFTSFPERWPDRKEFFEQIGEALEEDPRLRVLFAMREEYIAAVDPYVGLLPERLRTRYRLERLRRDAALLAVQGPLAGTGRGFGPGAAEKLVDNLLKVPVQGPEGTSPEGFAEFVEPVHLQVACQSLWRSLPPGDAPIDESSIDEYADVDQALTEFYEDCLRETMKATQIREGVLRRWFAQTLLTPQGTRGLVYKGAKTTGGILNEATRILEDLHLVRVEIRAGATWYELAHDRLIEPVRRSNARWNVEQSGVGRLYEPRAERWVEGGRRPEDLLAETEAEQAAVWLETPEGGDLASETLREFIETSRERAMRVRAETAARTTRRQRLQIMALAAGLLATLWLAMYAWRAQWKAEDATLVERGKAAKYLADRGDLFNAAVFGIQAVSSRLGESGRQIPREALEGLRASVEALGTSRWLREKSSIREVALSQDGRLAATWDGKGVSVWNASEGNRRFRKNLDLGERAGLIFSPGGQYLSILVSKEGDFRNLIWETLAGKSMERLESRLQGGTLLAFFRDDRRVLVCSAAECEVLDLSSGNSVGRFNLSPRRSLGEVYLSHRGTRAVFLHGDGEPGAVVDLRELPSGKPIAERRIAMYPRPVAFSDDDRLIAFGFRESGYSNGQVDLSVIDTDGRQLTAWSEDFRRLVSLGFVPDGKRILSIGSNEEGILGALRDAQTGALISLQRLKSSIPFSNYLSGGGRVLISTLEGPILWNALTGATKKAPSNVEAASADLSRGLALWEEGEAARVIDFDVPTLDVKSMSAPELLQHACRHLQYLPESTQVEKECRPWWGSKAIPLR